jgi:hypothetical protein
MVPFSWAFFSLEPMKFHPREGYYVWIGGMLTALFSNRIAGVTAHVTTSANAA